MIFRLITVLMFLVTLSLSFCSVSFAQDHNTGKTKSISGEFNLSEDLKAVLLEEMRAIEKGMTKLVHEISHGNWSNIEKIGKTIEESYIVKQKLSKQQMEELHRKLPVGFQRLDGKFHKLAGALARSAKERNIDLVVFYFYRLNESCARCHSKYAKSRFPGFTEKLEIKKSGGAKR